MASLQGRHALVTGGGRGIGRAIAAALTQAGAAVTIAGRNEKALADVVGRARPRATSSPTSPTLKLWTAACGRRWRRAVRSIC